MGFIILLLLAGGIYYAAKHKPTQQKQQTRRSGSREKLWTTPRITHSKLYEWALDETHLLVAGVTGSGKSVFIDGMISLALTRFPFDKEGGAQFIFIDPKGTEMQRYQGLPHVLRYADMNSGLFEALEYGYDIMQARFAENKKRGVKEYSGSDLYIVIDELAFLVWCGKKQLEGLFQQITALGRQTKVHLVVATQSPRNDIIPKALVTNIPATIGLKTSSKRESDIILGGKIEKYVDGKRLTFDGLQTLPDPRTEHRAECYYKTPSVDKDTKRPIDGLYNVPMVDDAEIERLIKHWMVQV